MPTAFQRPGDVKRLNQAILNPESDRKCLRTSELGVLYDPHFGSLHERRLFDERIILVMPHTQASERYIKAYAQRQHRRTLPDPLRNSSAWNPDAPPDPIRFTTPVPIEASFGVTGLMQQDEWRDPSDIEAARSLLQARFDLRLGIWDLVGNPLLRRTLLDATPSSSAPKRRAAIPRGAAKRAQRHVEASVASRTAEAVARKRITLLLAPLLKEGWKLTDRGSYCLDLSEPLPRPYNPDERDPLAYLFFDVTRRHASVLLGSLHGYEHVVDHAAELAEIARPGSCELNRRTRPVLWREEGGSADNVDWHVRATEVATRTKQWSSVLQTFLDESRRRYQHKVELYAQEVLLPH